MNWSLPQDLPHLLPRLLAAGAAVGLGGWLGWLLGADAGHPTLSACAGALAAVGLLVVVDALRAGRLTDWLRADSDTAAPPLAGVWGEIAYRTERSLIRRDRLLSAERQRLAGFLSAIEALPNGLLLLDEHDHITWCNPTAADHLGLHPQRDLGQPVTNLVRSPGFVAYLQAGDWQQPVATGMADREGTLLLQLRRYDHGQKLMVTQDITERQRADAMRRDLVANVSHEIRSPLTVLAGFIETMQTLPLGEAERSRMLLLMQQQSDRMQLLVADLLTLAQLEGSPRPPTDRWEPLPELMRRVAADAQALSGGRHTIDLVEGDRVELAGNGAELFSAVTNLATNAVRYTPDGGRIQLSWQLKPDGRVAIQVADTGIGIAREHIPRLTERFYRVDSSRSRETGGTGLGLAIVKHVAQRHGGTLDVESTLGEGSRFRLLLPPARVRLADVQGGVV
jgi:two-component system phosphate regulon sensor histidine kinase PhoR